MTELIAPPPKIDFHSFPYLRHTQRRLEHLASLGLPIAGNSVLEVGAGIGDHTSFFLDRNCDVTIAEPREENLSILRSRFPNQTILCLDLEKPEPGILPQEKFDIVYCYGVLYHVREPKRAIQYMARVCSKFLLLETCVSYGDEQKINIVQENQDVASQAISGYGCRPTRSWVFHALRENFEFVYMPVTQPWDEEFPLNWVSPTEGPSFTRAVFVASRQSMENDVLIEGIPTKQTRH